MLKHGARELNLGSIPLIQIPKLVNRLSLTGRSGVSRNAASLIETDA